MSIALAEDRLNTVQAPGPAKLLLQDIIQTTESAAVRQRIGECLQLDRGVQRLQGVVQTWISYLQFPTKKKKMKKRPR